MADGEADLRCGNCRDAERNAVMWLDEKKLKLYTAVAAAMAEDPENAAVIVEAMTAGIRERFTQVKMDSATWEAIARTALEPRIFGGTERFFAEQIEKLAPRATLNWSGLVERLRARIDRKARKEMP